MTDPTWLRAHVERLASSSAMRMYTSSRGMRSGISGTTPPMLIIAPPDPSHLHWSHMLFSELLFALLLVCLVAGMAIVAVTVVSINRRAEAQGAELAQLRTQLAAGGQVQESAATELRERLTQTQSLLEGMRAVFVSRHQVEEDARQSLRRLEAVIAGSPSRGAAGENILEEAFRHLPADMVRRNVWVA